MAQALVELIANLKEKEALRVVEQRLSAGEDPLIILDESRAAVQIVGDRFEAGKYFIPELVYAGEILQAVGELVKPRLAQAATRGNSGVVVIGTVAGDIHDIGKNIVAFMLDVNGFDVKDLGVDVPPEKFVKAAIDHTAQVVGLSAFLTGCFESMKATVQAFEEAGLREQVKIMIGGNYVNDFVCRQMGADGWGKDAGAAAQLCRGWIGGK